MPVAEIERYEAALRPYSIEMDRLLDALVNRQTALFRTAQQETVVRTERGVQHVALVAVARFAFNGSIDWYHGSIALVGVTIGGYLAAKNAHRIPSLWIRNAVIVYGVFMTGYFFWGAYFA